MFIGHIGERNAEGILEGRAGANYGWNLRENGFRYEKDEPSKTWPLPEDDAGFDHPLARIDHDDGGAVAGGFVYRGKALPDLVGKYLFGDIALGSVFYADVDSMTSPETPARVRKAQLVDQEGVAHGFDHFAGSGRTDLRFGRDAAGELYLLSKANGSIWAITGASARSETDD
jgi:glucose/arabinose dehydrogenase